MTANIESLRALLAAHLPLGGDTAQQYDAAGQCRCGQTFYARGGSPGAFLDACRRMNEAHVAHIAAVLQPLLDRLEAAEGIAQTPGCTYDEVHAEAVAQHDRAVAAEARLFVATGDAGTAIAERDYWKGRAEAAWEREDRAAEAAERALADLREQIAGEIETLAAGVRVLAREHRALHDTGDYLGAAARIARGGAR